MTDISITGTVQFCVKLTFQLLRTYVQFLNQFTHDSNFVSGQLQVYARIVIYFL